MEKSKLAILCADKSSIRAIHAAVSNSFQLVIARSEDGLRSVIANEPSVIAAMVDNVCGGAIDLLAKIQGQRDSVRRVLLTEYCDIGILVAGLHTGAVQEIIYKPVNAHELLTCLGKQVPSVKVHRISPRPIVQRAA